MACPPRAIWLVPILVLILPFLLLNWRTSPPRIPAFELRDRHNESLSSQAHESQEGYQLSSYIRRGERVWNLGVDIGTSCLGPCWRQLYIFVIIKPGFVINKTLIRMKNDHFHMTPTGNQVHPHRQAVRKLERNRLH